MRSEVVMLSRYRRQPSPVLIHKTRQTLDYKLVEGIADAVPACVNTPNYADSCGYSAESSAER